MECLFTHHEFVRTGAIVVGGFFALWFAAWRCRTADRQQETARLNLQNERYQKGIELLGSTGGGGFIARLGGAVALARLATEYPEKYHVMVMQAFEAFLTHPARYAGGPADGEFDADSPDTLAVINAVQERTPKQRDAERAEEYTFSLPSYAPYFMDEDTPIFRERRQIARVLRNLKPGAELPYEQIGLAAGLKGNPASIVHRVKLAIDRLIPEDGHHGWEILANEKVVGRPNIDC